MKHVWTPLLVFICHKYKPLRSASSPPPSPSLLVHNTHLHPCQMLVFSSPLSLTSLPNFPSCAAEHFYCLHFLLGVGSLLRAEYHPGNMIPANNYRPINQQCISAQTCRLAGLIYVPLFVQRADSSDRPLIYCRGWEGQDSQAAALHQSWIQFFSERDGSSVCGWRESRGGHGLRGADSTPRSSVTSLIASG